MKQEQSIENKQSYQSPFLNSLKSINVKYTASQFYPKSKTKIKNRQQDEIEKIKDLRQINKSSYSQNTNDKLPQTNFISQTNQLYSNQSRKKVASYQSSFTMKIIDHHISNQKQSNLIGKNAKTKLCARLYDQIDEINLKQQKIVDKYPQSYSQRIKARGVNNQKNGNADQQNPSSHLYKSLPQPFVNKKHLNSFDHPGLSTNYFNNRQNGSASQPKKKYSQQITKQLKLLQINLSKQVKQLTQQNKINDMLDQLTKINNSVNTIMQQTTMNRKMRYKKKKLEPLKINNIRQKMSNNIKDYLSVEKIQIKQIEEHLLSQTVNNLSQKNVEGQNLADLSLNRKKSSSRKDRNSHNTVGSIPMYSEQRIKSVKFVPPFSTYYYRDFLWKIAFSNELIVQSPPDYENKIKIFLGKGNNVNLIRGLIKRRPWYQITEKYQEAHFVWTQIKIQAYFSFQKKSQKQIQYHIVDSPLIQQKKSPLLLQTLNQYEQIKFTSYWNKNVLKEMKFKDNLKNRSRLLNLKQHSISQISQTMRIHNHFRNNYVIGNKKALFSLMSKHYSQNGQQVFNYLPLTFHIKDGLQDQQYLKFLNNFYAISKQIKKLEAHELNSYIYKYNAWIVKPGQNTNRGNGIIVCLNLNQVKAILKKKQKHNDGTNKTYILQKYIEKPLLYRRRKFDLRHYMLMSCSNGIMKGYWYKQGYVRTTSTQYTLKFSSGSVHLTNDAVQKQLPDYGKYQKGNKISYEQLNQFMKKWDSGFDFQTLIIPKMKKIATELIKASAKLMDPQKKLNNFQIFGLDFMIDEAYNVWLIECNTNPCLQLSCPLLGKIIPKMVENAFRICLDPVFMPPSAFVPKCQEYNENINEQNSFQLVYDERTDILSKQCKKQQNELLQNKEFQQDDDTFDDDGEAWDD